MLFWPHLILLHSILILGISYLFESSFNVHEKHYRSVSGLIARAHGEGHFIGNLVNLSVLLIYTHVARKLFLKSIENASLCCAVTGIGLLAFDIDEYRIMHFVFLVLFATAFCVLNLLLARVYKILFQHVAVVLCTTIVFFTLICLWPWSNIHTAAELTWLASCYYMIWAITYYLDHVQYHPPTVSYEVEQVP